MPGYGAQFRQAGERARQGDVKAGVNGGARRCQIALEVVHGAAHLAGVFLTQHFEDGRVGFAGVEDDRQVQAFGEVDVLSENLILDGVVGGIGQVIEADFGDANHARVVAGQGFQAGVEGVVHRVMGVHGVDADAGVEHRVVVSQGDAARGGFQGGAGQQDVAHAGIPGSLEDSGDFVRGELLVLVKVGVGIAVDGWRRCGRGQSGGHKGKPPEYCRRHQAGLRRGRVKYSTGRGVALRQAAAKAADSRMQVL